MRNGPRFSLRGEGSVHGLVRVLTGLGGEGEGGGRGGVDWLARRNGGMVFSVARVESCNARSAKEIQVLGEWIVRKGNQARAAAYGIVFF